MVLIETTIAAFPNESLDTQYGTIKYKEWLEKEKERFEANGRIVEIRKNARGRISLWANNLIEEENDGK